AVKEYRDRRDHLVRLLQDRLGGYIDFSVPTGGLAVWTKWPSGYRLMQFRAACARHDLYLPRYLLYQSKTYSGIRLGFGSLTPDEISEVVEIIAEVAPLDP